MTGLPLLLIGVAGVILLLLLVIYARMPAFIALLVVSVVTGLGAGIPLSDLMEVITTGVGNTLSSVLLVVGLGAVLGRIIELSGGADALASYFTRLLGPTRVVAAVCAAGFILGIPVFFDVGYIILAPIIFGFARTSKLTPVTLGIPLAGVLMVVHVIMPPHPGPVAVAGILEVDAGVLSSFGLLISIVAALVGFVITRRLPLDRVRTTATGLAGDHADTLAQREEQQPAISPWLVILLIVLPLVQIMVGTTGAMLAAEDSTLHAVVGFVGNPAIALLVAVLLAAFLVGRSQGWSWEKRAAIMDGALPLVAVIIFVTGAGGAFARVLVESGIGQVLSDQLVAWHLPLLMTAYLVALAIRVSQGSATVAMLTTAGIIADPVAAAGLDPLAATVVVCAIGCGALAASHINDSAFWIVTRYLGLEVKEGLATWTVVSTLFSLAGFAVCAALWPLVG